MDRSFWLSLTAVMASMAILVTVRASMEADMRAIGAGLMSEIAAIEGRAPDEVLADRVTTAAGCTPGVRPPDGACWLVWGDPTNPVYMNIVARRLTDKKTKDLAIWGGTATILWTLAALTVWKAWRYTKPSLMAPPNPSPRGASG